MDAKLDAFWRVIEGRLAMNSRTARIHSDATVRREAEVRVECYRLILADFKSAVGEKP